MGLIIRTAGAARTTQEIKRDFEYEIRLWESVRDMTLQSTAPCLVYEEGNLIKRSIRDLYSKDIDEILVAGEAAHKEAADFMRMLSPSQYKNVVKYEEPEPLFNRFQIERQLNAMFSPYVNLRSGGYLVINQTEALVSIDVNSGKSTREFSIEETALNTNLEAADEIARQLKLRDLAGLIVIDFIDMEEKRNNRAVERRLKDALRHDRARIQVGRISHFGLLEMSRQRLRTGVLEGSTSQCPHCQGTGIIRSVESVALAVLRALEDHLIRDSRNSITAVTTADVALYILNNKRPFVTDMERRYGLSITVQASDRMQGANFAIEKSAVQAAAPQKGQDRSSVVNMEWGFEGEAETEEAAEEARPASSEGEDGRRSRRRRRRGRREDRPEHRHERRARSEHAEAHAEGNGSDDADVEDAAPQSDDLHEASDQPAGLGEQPSLGRGEDENGERRGRRRRRGRRGGRRGRERDGVREAGGEEMAGREGNGSAASAGEEAEAFDPHEEPHAEPVMGEQQHERQYETAAAEQGREQAWQAPETEHRPAPATESAEREPAPSRDNVSAVVEAPEDPSRPARKGWWQRKLLG
jgi:ribonuclease E